MSPDIGDIWYCPYNDAYLFIINIFCGTVAFRWLDTWEEDATGLKLFKGEGEFAYRKIA